MENVTYIVIHYFHIFIGSRVNKNSLNWNRIVVNEFLSSIKYELLLNMDGANSSEKLVKIYITTWFHIPEDSLPFHSREDLK